MPGCLATNFQHLKALVSPIVFSVPDVEKEFSEEGEPVKVESVNKRAENFINELLWLCEKE